MELKINRAFADRRVIHHKSNTPMSKKTQAELLQIAIEARKSNNKILLECFEGLPTLEQLTTENAKVEIAAVPQAATNPKGEGEE